MTPEPNKTDNINDVESFLNLSIDELQHIDISEEINTDTKNSDYVQPTNYISNNNTQSINNFLNDSHELDCLDQLDLIEGLDELEDLFIEAENNILTELPDKDVLFDSESNVSLVCDVKSDSESHIEFLESEQIENNALDDFLLVNDDGLKIDELSLEISNIDDFDEHTTHKNSLKDFVVSDCNVSNTKNVGASNIDVSTAVARVAEYFPNHFIALSIHVTMELLERPRIQKIPASTSFTSGLILWQNQWIPLLNLARMLPLNGRLDISENEELDNDFYALVLAYQPYPKKPLCYGAILLHKMPHSILVSNKDVCSFPTQDNSGSDAFVWSDVAQSCIIQKGVATPIINTNLLFQKK